MNHEHPLGWSALGRIVIVLAGIYLATRLYGVVMMILLSLMLASALEPLVRFFDRKLPHVFSAILVILLLFLPFIIVVVSVLPGFIDQIPAILATLSSVLNNSTLLPANLRNIDLTSYLNNSSGYLLNSTGKITEAITTFFTIIFLSLYLLIDAKRLEKVFLDLLPVDVNRKRVADFLNKLAQINGDYIRGNLLISLVCTAVISIGLLILQVPYAIVLGIFAGVVDLLPLVGSTIGAIPAVILGFAISPTVGVLVILLFLFYQQVENNVLAPNIYNKILDLSPTLSFIVVIFGAALFGIVGAFVALPIAASIPTVVEYVRQVRAERKA
ncbi:AI-2E family transporter [Candidatus Curtissbacteria bacterium]|nr:AI-2E family transporter [Candidatus Curtissbacteria bacterium]